MPRIEQTALCLSRIQQSDRNSSNHAANGCVTLPHRSIQALVTESSIGTKKPVHHTRSMCRSTCLSAGISRARGQHDPSLTPSSLVIRPGADDGWSSSASTGSPRSCTPPDSQHLQSSESLARSAVTSSSSRNNHSDHESQGDIEDC